MKSMCLTQNKKERFVRYFISRHSATAAWAEKQGLCIDTWLTHLSDSSMLQAGDVVFGTLPIQLVAELTAKGVHYGHFSLTMPPHLRGVELDEATLAECDPKIVFFEVKESAPIFN